MKKLKIMKYKYKNLLYRIKSLFKKEEQDSYFIYEEDE